MSFIRPEARAALWRWREVLLGGAVLILGSWWAFGTFGLLHWLGFAVLVMGAVMIAAGIQRARFRMGRGGPGIVKVTERQVTYYGPLTGGVVAMSEMSSLILDPTAKPPQWVLSQPMQPDLTIPLTAEGAEALFDVFATLPGIRTEKMLSEMHRDSDQPVVIWQRPAVWLH